MADFSGHCPLHYDEPVCKMDGGAGKLCTLAESEMRECLARLPAAAPPAAAQASVQVAWAGGGAAGGAPQLPAGGQEGGAAKHSRFLMPLIHCIRDKLSGGGEGRANAPPFPYAAMRAAAEGAGFLFSRMAACYADDWRARDVTEGSLRLTDGHAPGWRQEELLFPAPGGQSRVPQALYNHLVLLVSQMESGARLDPTVDGLAAANSALLAWGF